MATATMDVQERGRWLTFVAMVAFLLLAPLAVLVVLPTLTAWAPGRFWPWWVVIGLVAGPLTMALYFRLLWPRGYPDTLVMLGITWWALLLFLLVEEELLHVTMAP